MTAFESILARFADAVARNDPPALAALFTEDGCYDDYFFGLHEGRQAIAAMLDRFQVGGEAFCWQFDEPIESNGLGYTGYRFSYLSKEPESTGRLIVFEGMGRFRLRDGLIEHYKEVFDRGLAFAQLGYAPARTGKLLDRYATSFRDSPAVQHHLEYRSRRG